MVAAVAICMMANAKPAEAVTVTYYTIGCFGSIPPCNATAFAGGGANVAAAGFLGAGTAATPVSVNEPTTASLGLISSVALGTGATFTAVPFNLFIVQSQPGVGAGGLVAELNGTLTPTSSGAKLTFSVADVTIAGVNYAIINNPLSLPAPSTVVIPGFPAFASIEATITAVPEPGTMLMFGTALVGLVANRRKLLRRSLDA